MEGIVRDRVTGHFMKQKLISIRQHGFVQKKACVTNLLECQHIVSESLSRGKSVDVLIGKILEWIKSFLRNRSQQVVIGEVESSCRVITCGVPQGSVLGI